MAEQKDVSIAWALSLLFVAALAFGLMSHSEAAANLWINARPALYNGRHFLAAIGLSVFGNLLLAIAIFERTFGYKRQGSRLRSIQGDRSKGSLHKAIPLAALGYLLIYFLGLNSIIEGGLDILLSGWEQNFKSEIFIFINTSFAITLFFAASLALKFAYAIQGMLGSQKRLLKYPETKNSLVIGSVGEEKSFDDEEQPRWVTLEQKALNGNILVTGSIGSGKTQGTILVFVDQILKHFSPRPSMLILDPKGTFIPEVRKIAESHGLKGVL